MMNIRQHVVGVLLVLMPAGTFAAAPPKASETKDIKAYCIDFNWAATGRKRKPFATRSEEAFLQIFRTAEVAGRWVTEELVRIAEQSASKRIVSTLEGGYELHSLARCTELHLRVLMGLH